MVSASASVGLHSLDLVVLGAYLGGCLLIGYALSKKSANTSEFMAAGGSLPGWAVGLSIFGTYVSSISFLANPGKSYADNWSPFVFSLSLPLAAWIAVRYFVQAFRRSEDISAYTQLERRFGGWARTYAVLCFLALQLARVATILYLVALAIGPLTNWSIASIIIVTGVLVTIYTLMGGIEAVIWTDVLQSLVLSLGILVAIGFVAWHVPGGISEVLSTAWTADKFSLGDSVTSLTGPSIFVVLVYGLFINLQNFAVDQTYVQRYATAKTDSEANYSVWLGALLYIPVSALLLFVGTSLYVYYSNRPPLLQANGEPMAADAVFPHFIVADLPAGLTGLLIAAILAAAMSSVSSSLNSAATLLLCDVYKRYHSPFATERESMFVLYVATLLCGVAGTAAGLAMMQAESVLDVWWQLAGVAGGGLLGLFMLGRFCSGVQSLHAAIGVMCGIVVITWMFCSRMSWWPEQLSFFVSPFHEFLTIVFGTLTVIIVGVVASRVLPRFRRATPEAGA
jgi:SSS family solute:Na+ symporter